MADIGKAYVQIIPKATGISSKIEAELGGAGKTGGAAFNKGFGSVVGSVGKVAASALAAGTAAVGAFGAASIKAGSEFDKAMAQVGATMLKTSTEMENEIGSVDTAYGSFEGNLRDFAQFLGQNTVFSATQAAEALNYMALAGYNTQQSMDMLPNVLSLAAAGGMDLARASDMITDSQTAFGISAERTSQMVDEMAKAASTGNTSVEQLGDAFLVVGGLAQELNGGFVTLKDGTKQSVDGVQEMEIALTAMANAGVKGSEAGTHMRNMLLKLSSPTEAGAVALDRLGVSVFDAEGKMRSLSDIFGDMSGAMDNLSQEEKITAISKIFNTRDIASAEALLNAVTQDWDAIGASILDAEGAAAEMSKIQLDNLAGDTTLFQSALEGAKIAISDSLTPTLREFVQFGTEGLSTLTSAFQSGGLSGAMDAFGTIISDALNMILSKAPSLVSAGMQLIQSLWQGITAQLPTITTVFMQLANMILPAIISALPEILQAGIELIIMLGQGIAGAIPTLTPIITQCIVDLVTILSDPGNLTGVLQAGLAIIMALGQGLIQALPQLLAALPIIIDNLVQFIVAATPQLLEAAMLLTMAIIQATPQIATQVAQMAPQIIQSLSEGIIAAAPILLAQIPIMIAQVGQAILQAIPQLLAAVGQIFMAIIASIGQYGGQLMSQIQIHLQNVMLSIQTTLGQLPYQLGYIAGTAVTNFVSFIQQLPGKVVTAFNNVIAKLKDFANKFIQEGPRIAREFASMLIENLASLPGQVAEIAGSIVSALKEGILARWEDLKSSISGAVSDFVQGLKDAAGGGGENGGDNKQSGGGEGKGGDAAASAIASIATSSIASMTPSAFSSYSPESSYSDASISSSNMNTIVEYLSVIASEVGKPIRATVGEQTVFDSVNRTNQMQVMATGYSPL